MQAYIEAFIQETIESFQQVANLLTTEIEQASILMVNCLLNEGKIISCGNGCSAICAQYFAVKLLNHFEQERPSLPALSLTNHATITAIGNDYNFTEIYSKQIRALGNSKDILLAITTHNNSVNIIEAIQAAHDRGMSIIALTHSDNQEIRASLLADDIEICIPYHNAIVPVQQAHLLIIDSLCNLIDHQLFGSD